MFFLNIEDRVQKGIDYLNKNYPDWLDQINIDRLDLNDPFDCILGQLFGNFSRSNLNWVEVGEYGFDRPHDLYEEYNEENVANRLKYFEDLTFFWKKKIRALRVKSTLTGIVV